MNQESFIHFFMRVRPAIKVKLTVVFLTAMVITFGSAASIYTILNANRKLTLTEEVLSKSRKLASEVPEYTYAYELKDISIPLTNRKHTRSAFAQFTLILDCPNEEAKKNLTAQLPKILDAILVVGSGYYVEDFTPPLAETGFARFKTEIKTNLAAFLHSAAPREVVLKDWFVN